MEYVADTVPVGTLNGYLQDMAERGMTLHAMQPVTWQEHACWQDGNAYCEVRSVLVVMERVVTGQGGEDHAA